MLTRLPGPSRPALQLSPENFHSAITGRVDGTPLRCYWDPRPVVSGTEEYDGRDFAFYSPEEDAAAAAGTDTDNEDGHPERKEVPQVPPQVPIEQRDGH